MDHSNERGQSLAFTPLVVFAALVGLAAVAFVARSAISSARAQAGADATVLAWAVGGDPARRQVASDNGVSVVASHRSGHEREVVVAVGDARARARAEIQHIAAVRRAGLAPAMVAALARAEQLLGFEVRVVSGYRSREHQERLWEQRESNPYPVARPGTSRHELGLAVDVGLEHVAALARVGADAGLCHPLPESDPVHFEVCPNPG